MATTERRVTRLTRSEWLTPEQFAHRLGVKRSRVYKWMERGVISMLSFGPSTKPTYLIHEREMHAVAHLLEH